MADSKTGSTSGSARAAGDQGSHRDLAHWRQDVSMNRVPVQPNLVRWARERAGYSVDALVGRFPKIGAWECGELLPTLKQLEAFAKATHIPSCQ